MKPIHWIIVAAIIVLAAIGYFVFDPFGGPTSASTLVNQALTGKDEKEKMEAVGALGMRKDKTTALPALKKVATESKDGKIKAFALTNIIYFMDRESLPVFYEALKDEDRQVRKAAYDGLMTYFGQRLPNDLHLQYKIDGDAAERADIAAKLKAEFDKPAPMP